MRHWKSGSMTVFGYNHGLELCTQRFKLKINKISLLQYLSRVESPQLRLVISIPCLNRTKTKTKLKNIAKTSGTSTSILGTLFLFPIFFFLSFLFWPSILKVGGKYCVALVKIIQVYASSAGLHSW